MLGLDPQRPVFQKHPPFSASPGRPFAAARLAPAVDTLTIRFAGIRPVEKKCIALEDIEAGEVKDAMAMNVAQLNQALVHVVPVENRTGSRKFDSAYDTLATRMAHFFPGCRLQVVLGDEQLARFFKKDASLDDEAIARFKQRCNDLDPLLGLSWTDAQGVSLWERFKTLQASSANRQRLDEQIQRYRQENLKLPDTVTQWLEDPVQVILADQATLDRQAQVLEKRFAPMQRQARERNQTIASFADALETYQAQRLALPEAVQPYQNLSTPAAWQSPLGQSLTIGKINKLVAVLRNEMPRLVAHRDALDAFSAVLRQYDDQNLDTPETIRSYQAVADGRPLPEPSADCKALPTEWISQLTAELEGELEAAVAHRDALASFQAQLAVYRQERLDLPEDIGPYQVVKKNEVAPSAGCAALTTDEIQRLTQRLKLEKEELEQERAQKQRDIQQLNQLVRHYVRDEIPLPDVILPYFRFDHARWWIQGLDLDQLEAALSRKEILKIRQELADTLRETLADREVERQQADTRKEFLDKLSLYRNAQRNKVSVPESIQFYLRLDPAKLDKMIRSKSQAELEELTRTLKADFQEHLREVEERRALVQACQGVWQRYRQAGLALPLNPTSRDDFDTEAGFERYLASRSTEQIQQLTRTLEERFEKLLAERELAGLRQQVFKLLDAYQSAKTTLPEAIQKELAGFDNPGDWLKGLGLEMLQVRIEALEAGMAAAQAQRRQAEIRQLETELAACRQAFETLDAEFDTRFETLRLMKGYIPDDEYQARYRGLIKDKSDQGVANTARVFELEKQVRAMQGQAVDTILRHPDVDQGPGPSTDSRIEHAFVTGNVYFPQGKTPAYSRALGYQPASLEQLQQAGFQVVYADGEAYAVGYLKKRAPLSKDQVYEVVAMGREPEGNVLDIFTPATILPSLASEKTGRGFSRPYVAVKVRVGDAVLASPDGRLGAHTFQVLDHVRKDLTGKQLNRLNQTK